MSTSPSEVRLNFWHTRSGLPHLGVDRRAVGVADYAGRPGFGGHTIRFSDEIREEDYPQEWQSSLDEGLTFPISYHFEPGAAEDGLTIDVPVAFTQSVIPIGAVLFIIAELLNLPDRIRNARGKIAPLESPAVTELTH